MKNFVRIIVIISLIIVSACKKEKGSSNLAVLTIDSITKITLNSATCYVHITSDMGVAVTERGICWSTSTTPTIADSKISAGADTGIFSGNITGLEYANYYYVRAYAISNAGTSYATVRSFRTLGGLPSTSFSTTSEADSTSVVLYGLAAANSLPTKVILEYGKADFYGDTVSTVPNYAYGDSATTVTGRVHGLSKGTLYHFRLKVSNVMGANYSTDKVLTTAGK